MAEQDWGGFITQSGLLNSGITGAALAKYQPMQVPPLNNLNSSTSPEYFKSIGYNRYNTIQDWKTPMAGLGEEQSRMLSEQVGNSFDPASKGMFGTAMQNIRSLPWEGMANFGKDVAIPGLTAISSFMGARNQRKELGLKRQAQALEMGMARGGIEDAYRKQMMRADSGSGTLKSREEYEKDAYAKMAKWGMV